MINYSSCERITRREFTKQLGQIGVGMSALALTGCGPHAGGQTKLRRLGRTDLVLSPLGFGAQHTVMPTSFALLLTKA